MKIINYEGSY